MRWSWCWGWRGAARSDQAQARVSQQYRDTASCPHTHSSPFITYRALDNLPDWPSYPGFINCVAFLIFILVILILYCWLCCCLLYQSVFCGLPAWASLIRILGCVFYSSQFPLRLLPADNDWSCITGCENMLIFNRIH